MNALELENVSVGYETTEVIHQISFSLEEGACLAILGPNGSGKTTLLRALAGLLPAEGSIRICGQELHSLKRAQLSRKVAMMSQFTGAALPYTVYETVLLGRYLHMQPGLFSRPAPEDIRVVEQCIEAVGLSGMEKMEVTELSGGQLQRVFLARTLAQEPSIILLDEPTSHLDLRYQTELVDYLKTWGALEGHTVIGVLHDLSLALRLADTMLFLKEGKIVSFGPLKEAVSYRLLEQVYGMDVSGYLHESLRQLEEVCHE